MPEALALIPALIGGVGSDIGAGLGGLGSLFGGAGAAAPAVAGAADAGAAAIPAVAGAADAGAAAAIPGAADLGATAAGATAGAAGTGSLFDAIGSALGLGGGAGASAAPLAAAAPLDLSATSAAPAIASAGPGISGAASSAAGAAAPASVSAAAPDITSALSTIGTDNAAESSLLSQAGAQGFSGADPLAAGATGGPLAAANPLSTAAGTPAATTATPAAVAPAATTPAATATGGFNPLGSIGSSIAKNPLSLVGAGGLVYDLIKGNQPPGGSANYDALTAQAQQADAQSQQQESYLTSGTLPPGVQASVDAAKESAMATIRSQYANMGQSGSSAEAEALSNAEQLAVSSGATIATQLYSTGITQAQLSDQIYQSLMQAMVQQDTAMSQAVGNFAGSLAVMGSRTT